MTLPPFVRPSALRCLAAVGTVLLLLGCASSRYQAPVEDRSVAGSRAGVAAGSASAVSGEASKPPPGIENAGKPGFYSVKPGDTLIRIGLESGQNWRDIQKWNNLENPNLLEVGQVVRVVPPGVDAAVTGSKPVAPSRVEARPLDAKPSPDTGAASTSGTSTAAATASSDAVRGAASSADGSKNPSAAATPSDDGLSWMWPAAGSVTAGFDEARNKGLAITGKAGDAVMAAADGRVVYAGSGLRGYGNLVIIKHNATYLTAYAHNQTLLVKEDQAVRRGQKIAEMGNTDADKVGLHFEVRRNGKPVDPAKVLPAR
jgi:lipoprotein NlpD